MKNNFEIIYGVFMLFRILFLFVFFVFSNAFVFANELNLAKKEGKRIICVGTTSLRTLESIYSKYGCFKEVKEDTNIFIYPPYKIKSADCLITNFHLPKSTLIMLVSAFAGKEKIMNAYEEAIKMNYRFFSFGDAMFIK